MESWHVGELVEDGSTADMIKSTDSVDGNDDSFRVFIREGLQA